MAEYDRDAFISYATPDRRLAVEISDWIRRYRPPRGVDSERRRLTTFLDVHDIRAGSTVDAALRKELDRCRFLVVVCSPETHRRSGVELETEHFLETRGAEYILCVNAYGNPVETCPRVLLDYYVEDRPEEQEGYDVLFATPLVADLRPRDGLSPAATRQEELLRIVAALLDCDYEELAQRERRRRRIRRGLLAAGGLMVLGLVVAIGYLSQKAAAEQERADLARRHAAAQEERANEEQHSAAIRRALLVSAHLLRSRPDAIGESTLLATAAAHDAPSRETLGYLRRSLETIPRRGRPSIMTDEPIRTAAIASEGGLVLGLDDGRVLHVSAGRAEPRQLLDAPARIRGVVVDASGSRVAAMDDDGTVYWWTEDEGEARVLRREARRGHLAIHPDGGWLAIAVGRTLRVHEIGSTNSSTSVELPRPAREVLFAPGDAIRVGILDHQRVSIYDAGLSSLRRSEPLGVQHAFAFSGDGGALAAGGRDGRVRIFELDAAPSGGTSILHPTRSIEVSSEVFELQFSPEAEDGILVVGASDGVVRVHDSSGARPDRVFRHGENVQRLAVPSLGTVLTASGRVLGDSEDDTVRLWMHDGRRVELRIAHDGLLHLRAIGMTPEGEVIVVESNEVSFWEPESVLSARLATPEGARTLSLSDGMPRVACTEQACFEATSSGHYRRLPGDLPAAALQSRLSDVGGLVVGVGRPRMRPVLEGAFQLMMSQADDVMRRMLPELPGVSPTPRRQVLRRDLDDDDWTAVTAAGDRERLELSETGRFAVHLDATEVTVWDVRAAQRVAGWEVRDARRALIAFSDDDASLAIGARESDDQWRVRVVSTDDWDEVDELEESLSSRPEAIAVGGDALFVATDDCEVRAGPVSGDGGWSTEFCAAVLELGPDSRLLAGGSADGELRVWAAADGRDLLAGFMENEVGRIVFSPDSSTALAAATENQMGADRLIPTHATAGTC